MSGVEIESWLYNQRSGCSLESQRCECQRLTQPGLMQPVLLPNTMIVAQHLGAPPSSTRAKKIRAYVTATSNVRFQRYKPAVTLKQDRGSAVQGSSACVLQRVCDHTSISAVTITLDEHIE